MEKSALIFELNEAHRNLLMLLQNFAQKDFEVPGVSGDWTAKDLCAHLAFWNWEAERNAQLALAGERPAGWLDVSEADWEAVNQREANARKHKPLTQIMEDFRRSQKALVNLIERASLQALNAESRHKTSAGASANAGWLIAELIGHYQHHQQLLKTWLETHKPSRVN